MTGDELQGGSSTRGVEDRNRGDRTSESFTGGCCGCTKVGRTEGQAVSKTAPVAEGQAVFKPPPAAWFSVAGVDEV
jgi:hypothetical protein